MSSRSLGEGGLAQWFTFMFCKVYNCLSAIMLGLLNVGVTDDPMRRLEEHNSGKSIHTNKFKPWKMAVSVGFSEAAKATAFETYLKSGSGRAFAKKHF
jgi:putative endonuclease